MQDNPNTKIFAQAPVLTVSFWTTLQVFGAFEDPCTRFSSQPMASPSIIGSCPLGRQGNPDGQPPEGGNLSPSKVEPSAECFALRTNQQTMQLTAPLSKPHFVGILQQMAQ